MLYEVQFTGTVRHKPKRGAHRNRAKNRGRAAGHLRSTATERMATETAVFRIDGVSKSYGGIPALDGVTLDAGVNEYVSLLGPSGSGKTTLLRVVAGFEVPDKGRVFFQGRDITNLPAHERGIGFVFQNFALFPHLTVRKNVAFGMMNGASQVSASEIDRRTQAVIDMVGLSGMEDRGVDQISGGQRQRVALARTLVMQP